jgi:hypothetical protein
VYRPKTCGVIPTTLSDTDKLDRPKTTLRKPNAQPMDLAIGWEYRTKNEPKSAVYMDGSKPSVAPPIFEIVQNPKEINLPKVVHTGGVFSNTLGEEDFFERDIIRQHNEYTKNYDVTNRCKCGNRFKSGDRGKKPSSGELPEVNRNGSRNGSSSKKSPKPKSPDMRIVSAEPRMLTPEDAKRDNKIPRICHTINYGDNLIFRVKNEICAFKAGVPQSNASGTCSSFDSGISMTSPHKGEKKKLHIPKPRNPYTKKNYVIDTLAPPFALLKEGSGYPDYWRLVSVYQTAYKPMEKRQYPLLKTVYQ